MALLYFYKGRKIKDLRFNPKKTKKSVRLFKTVKIVKPEKLESNLDKELSFTTTALFIFFRPLLLSTSSV
jgi:hypothetical protein